VPNKIDLLRGKLLPLPKRKNSDNEIVGRAERFHHKVHMHTQKKLRLGLLLDSFNVPAWVDDVIRRIVNENAGEFVLVVLNSDSGKPSKNNGSTIVYSIFDRIDRRLFTKKPDPFALKNVAGLFSHLPIFTVVPLKVNDDYFLGEPDIQVIKDYRLDILIKLGFESWQVENLNIARYGTWFYHHGDDTTIRGGPPGFWEVVENSPETVSALMAIGGEFPPGRVLFRSHLVTYPFSPARHRSYYFWATTSFLPRQISLLQRLGKENYFRETQKFNTGLPHKIKKDEAPSNSLAIKSIAKIFVRLGREIVRRFFYADQWFLLFSLERNISDDLKDFIKLIPPKDEFWADPHVTQVDGKYYIFIEEFLSAKNKGHISVIELDASGNWKAPVKVLEKDYHLSYPFIFKWNDKFYMVPESRANKTIDLYECAEFPYKWNFKQHLMENVSAVDTTLIHYSGKWWLFTALAENEAAAPNVELFLFYADDIFTTDWTAHPRNPIISDVKSARPAGSLFVKDGKLFRPSQDCSKAYGYGFDLNEIKILTETEYCETKKVSVRPTWDKNVLATHTFANCGDLTVVDAFTQTRKF
jgi:hypothetical protein